MANKSPNAQYDIFKDSLIRYCGYANEVGEAFRALVNVRLVWASYGVASCYVVADATHKAWRAYSQKSQLDRGSKAKSVAVAYADTLIWQSFASVIIPGFTINRICRLTGIVLAYTTKLSSPVRKWSTVAVGLGCIPLIIHPIDRSVDYVMDKSVRELYHYHPRAAKG